MLQYKAPPDGAAHMRCLCNIGAILPILSCFDPPRAFAGIDCMSDVLIPCMLQQAPRISDSNNAAMPQPPLQQQGQMQPEPIWLVAPCCIQTLCTPFNPSMHQEHEPAHDLTSQSPSLLPMIAVQTDDHSPLLGPHSKTWAPVKPLQVTAELLMQAPSMKGIALALCRELSIPIRFQQAP